MGRPSTKRALCPPACLAAAAAVMAAPALAAAPAPGDVVISEILIDAPSATEWFELVNVSAADVELDGCVISEVGTGTENADTIDALTIPAGGYVVLADGADCVVFTEGGADEGACVAPADYTYSALTFNNGEEEVLRLTCSGETVDEVTYDWTLHESTCTPGLACSVNVAPGELTAEDNDDFEDHWCVPLDVDPYYDENGLESVGTPGAANRCVSFDWPEEGAVVFTEIMVAPQDAPEWFEVWNAGDRDVELTLCSVRRFREDESGEPDPSTWKEFVIGEDGRTLRLAADEVRVFSYKECLPEGEHEGDGSDDDTSGDDDTAGGDDDDGLPSCEDGDFTYDTLTLTNDATEHLVLVCPDGGTGEVEIDDAPYDPTSDGVREGHSLMFEPGNPDNAATANDDRERWCEAAFSQCFYDAGDGNCNYGTPGELGECLTDDVDWPDGGPDCRCGAAAASPGGLEAAGAAACAVVLLRRRSRRVS